MISEPFILYCKLTHRDTSRQHQIQSACVQSQLQIGIGWKNPLKRKKNNKIYLTLEAYQDSKYEY